MAEETNDEIMLTNNEVEKILVESLDKPDKIYHGPEEEDRSDQFLREDTTGDLEGNEEEEEVDPVTKLSFEKRSAMEHVREFSRIEKEKAEKMISELVKFERLTETHAYKIAELMPRDETELRPIFAKDRFTLEPEDLKQIIEIVDEHRD